MKFFVCVTVLIAASVLTTKAAIVSGKVVDESGNPMEFVNVIAKSSVGKSSYGAVTGVDGSFRIMDIPNGKYTLTSSFVGYNPASKHIVVNRGSVNAGVLEMGENSTVLQEVEVKGVKSQMKFELDRKVFNVEADLAAAGVSASELLENIPSIEVDNDGAVSLRGNSSVTIWINGKDAGLTSDNQADILEQLPAESIERVEIITNPSAKYSPEGTAGIINIVMKRNSLLGYFGSARASVNSQKGYNANVSGNFNFGKWETNIGVGFRHNENDRNSLSRRTYDDGTFLNSDQKTENNRNNMFLRGGVAYYLDDYNEFYMNGFGMFGKGSRDGSTVYDSDQPGQTLIGQTSSNDNKMRGGMAIVGYKHTFAENHTLDISANFNKWGGGGPNENWQNYTYEEEFLDENNEPQLRTWQDWQMQSTDIANRNFEYQADYTLPIAKKFRFETGYKGRHGRENSPTVTYSGDSQDNMQLDEDLYNRFIYEQNIQALYATIGGTVGKLSFQGGMRGEYWQVRTKSLAYGESEAGKEMFKDNNFQLFPSAFVSYSFPKQNEMQVNYTRRIRRPWGGQLNSFHNTSDPTNISYGNPYLDPEYSNAFELNYIKTWEKHMASVSAYYRSTDNVIQRINFINDQTGVMNTTFDNVSQSISTGAEVIFKDNFFNILDLTTTVNLFYYQLDGFSYTPENSRQVVSDDGDSNFSWNIRAIARVMLPLGFSAQVNGGYNAPMVIAQGKRDGNYRLDASLRKDFGKWAVNLNVRDILDSRSRESTTYGNGYSQYSKNWGSGRRFQITVSYNFGNMKAKPNKHTQGEVGGMGGGEDMDY